MILTEAICLLTMTARSCPFLWDKAVLPLHIHTLQSQLISQTNSGISAGTCTLPV
jgi:hypothetical protein